MSDTEIAHGPIDYLIVEWPAGTQPNGEGLKELANLSDRGLIRVLDLVFVTKGEDGAVAGLALADIDSALTGITYHGGDCSWTHGETYCRSRWNRQARSDGAAIL